MRRTYGDFYSFHTKVSLPSLSLSHSLTHSLSHSLTHSHAWPQNIGRGPDVIFGRLEYFQDIKHTFNVYTLQLVQCRDNKDTEAPSQQPQWHAHSNTARLILCFHISSSLTPTPPSLPLSHSPSLPFSPSLSLSLPLPFSPFLSPSPSLPLPCSMFQLLDQFPGEGGQRNKKDRMIPFLPGKSYPRILTNRNNRDLAEKRLPELHRYAK